VWAIELICASLTHFATICALQLRLRYTGEQKHMINNFFEVWYWILMLAGLIGIAIWRCICLVQYLWAAFKKRKKDLPHNA
jgi:amino acid permease